MNTAYTLSNGALIPAIGFGTWEITPSEDAEKAVKTALEAGYRHIDTAKIYGNEDGVSKAIHESGIPREEIFVTTKLWDSDQPYDSALRAVDASLERLGLDYVDLYLIHWPKPTRHDAWRAMVEIQKTGKAKAIGVSNFTIRHLGELLEFSDVVPQVNQVEFHPFIYDNQKALLSYCKERDILVEAYSPLSRHSKASIPEIEQIAEKLAKTTSQVILRWCLQHGTVPLPRSQNLERISENFAVFDFELSDDDMKVLDSLSDGERVTWDPEEME